MKPGKGDLVLSDPGIRNGSRWNIGPRDYTAKVNADKTITFSAMAEGEELMFRLTPNYSRQNEYILSDEPGGSGTNVFSNTPRVKLIDKYGTKLLCLYDQKGLLQHVLDGKARGEGLDVALDKWDIQLAGRYVDKYGDFTFEQKAFNEIDNLVFCSLSYLNFTYTSINNYDHTLEYIGREYLSNNTFNGVKKRGIPQKNGYKLLRKIVKKRRYKNRILGKVFIKVCITSHNRSRSWRGNKNAICNKYSRIIQGIICECT
jgi:hypothetical protein